MRNQLKYFFAGIFLVLGIAAFSQNEASKWYFGDHAGLDFMTSPPTILTNGALNSIEGTASIADGAGNLLFYTDGITIWNQSHAVMANGFGLLGNGSTSQAALIVKQPGNQNIYFVFTLNEAGNAPGLRYSVVDMNLAAGMGSVTIKNTLIHTPSSEKLCGVKHCNGTDIWVVSHDYHSNNFRANLVTSAGVSSSAVISSLGSTINQIPATVGCMKISPNGKKLGLAIYSPPTFELYDFNTATGVVSNLIPLPVASPLSELPYGCEFSPDGTKFYGTCEVFNTSLSLYQFSLYQLYQWDLCAGPASAIAASQHTMTASEVGEMQLAPDGKIYVARSNSNYPQPSTEYMLGVIHNPNANFPAINYVNTGQSIFPKVSIYGLPNFVSGFYKTPVAQFTYTVDPMVSCVTASFTSPPLINNACSATSYTIDHLIWLFGDPASGAGNTSTIANPTHTYPGNGVYNAKLILYNQCGGVIDTLKQQVMVTQVPLATSTSNFSLCAGQSMTLTASGLATYLWSTGAVTNTISITPGTTTTYTVEGLGLNGCPLKSVQAVTVNPVPVITLLGGQIACAGSVFTQTASGAASYTWSNGTIGPVLNVPPPAGATYTVTGESHGCLSTAVATATILAGPPLTVTGAHSVCIGSSVLQTAAGASSYTWSNGATTNSVILSPVGSSVFTITVKGTGSNGCTSYLTLSIFCYYAPIITITGNHTVCPGNALMLTANGASTYSWSNGNNTAVTSVTPATITTYTVTGTDIMGCVNTAIVTANTGLIPLLAVSNGSACSGGAVTLTITSAISPGIIYTWFPGALSGPSVQVSAVAPRIYTVIATDVNGCTNSAQSTLTIVQPQNSLAGFSYQSPVCQGAGNLAPNFNQGFSTGGIFSNDSLTIDAGTGHINMEQASAGSYLISYSITQNGCVESVKASLYVLAAPQLNIGPQVNIAPGTSATLHVSGAGNYTWSPADNLSCDECESPVASPVKDMQYCVFARKGSCLSSACVDVIVTCETNNDFSVPNAFTPNGDNNNDEFCLKGWNDCTSDFRVLIYDRWGEKVFESTEALFCWDGIYKGKPLNTGVFIYVIHAKKFKGDAVDKKGNITLIR